MTANWKNPRWTKEDDAKLIRLVERNDVEKRDTWDYIAEHYFPTRSQGAVRVRYLNLKKKEQKQEWDKDLSRAAFNLYLDSKPTKEIFDFLQEEGDTHTVEELEQELDKARRRMREFITKYAEERGLKVARTLSLDTMRLFRDQYQTTSDFVRKGLHIRIQNG